MRWVAVLCIVLLLSSSVSAFYIKEDTFQVKAGHHSPIIFVPGVMGSALVDTNRWTWSDELWPGMPHEWRNELSFENDGSTQVYPSAKIRATHVLRHVLWVKSIYGGFFDYMDEFTPYVYNGEEDGVGFLRRAYFDHPYDFRLKTEDHLNGKSSIHTKVKEVLKHTRSDKVILVAHSMGGLQAKYYADKHPENVRAIIFLSSPLQGAPRAFQSVTEGYNFGAGAVITEKHVWDIGHNWPGIFHLMPNKPFISVDGDLVSLEDGYKMGVNWQQYRAIPQSFFDGLAAKGITDPAAVTAAVEKAYGGISKDLIKDTAGFRRKFDSIKLDKKIHVEIIHGDGQQTTESFISRDEQVSGPAFYQDGWGVEAGQRVPNLVPFTFTIKRFDRVDANRGDETVYLRGLQWDGAEETQSVNHGHMAMASHPDTLNKMIAIVELINHDRRDDIWTRRIGSIAGSNLLKLKSLSENVATKQSENYGETLKSQSESGKDDLGYFRKLIGDIRGRGKYVFFHRLIDGKINNVQIIVPEVGDYSETHKEFRAWVALDGYIPLEAGIGTISPRTYTVKIDQDTFTALMDGRIELKHAFNNGKLDVSGDLRANFALWVTDWVRRFTS